MWIKFKEQEKYHLYENGRAVCDYIGISQTEEAIVQNIECYKKCKKCYNIWFKEREEKMAK